VLLQRQHYKVALLAWRRARRKHMRAALWNTLTWPYRALTAPTLVGDSAERVVGTVPRHAWPVRTDPPILAPIPPRAAALEV
jgi:hypothetical protein